MKKIQKNDNIKLLVGSPEFKNKIYKVLSVKGDYVELEGYKTRKKSRKITQENVENFIYLNIPVHISNVALSVDGNSGKVAIVTENGKKIRKLKKSI